MMTIDALCKDYFKVYVHKQKYTHKYTLTFADSCSSRALAVSAAARSRFCTTKSIPFSFDTRACLYLDVRAIKSSRACSSWVNLVRFSWILSWISLGDITFFPEWPGEGGRYKRGLIWMDLGDSGELSWTFRCDGRTILDRRCSELASPVGGTIVLPRRLESFWPSGKRVNEWIHISQYIECNDVLQWQMYRQMDMSSILQCEI